MTLDIVVGVLWWIRITYSSLTPRGEEGIFKWFMNILMRIIIPAVFFSLLGPLSLVREAKADLYVRKDSQGVVHFTNVPSHSGYRRIIRGWSKGFPISSRAPGRLEEIIRSVSKRYGLDPHLVRSVIKVESDFNSQARSRKGAQGLMQLMPETARLYKVSNVYEPEENIDGGVRHLKSLLNRYQGDLRLTLAAYNAGINAVNKHGGVPPFAETREYVRRVLNLYHRYHGNGTISIKEQARR